MDLTQTDLVIGSFQFANANINFDTCHYGCHGLIVSLKLEEIGTYLFSARSISG